MKITDIRLGVVFQKRDVISVLGKYKTVLEMDDTDEEKIIDAARTHIELSLMGDMIIKYGYDYQDCDNIDNLGNDDTLFVSLNYATLAEEQ